MISAASPGDNIPSAQASGIAAAAAGTSLTHSTLGNAKATGRSRRGGNTRSRQSRMATMSPSNARSITLRVSAGASPSSSSSIARVALLRWPFGRPLGLPLVPRSNGRPREPEKAEATAPERRTSPGLAARTRRDRPPTWRDRAVLHAVSSALHQVDQRRSPRPPPRAGHAAHTRSARHGRTWETFGIGVLQKNAGRRPAEGETVGLTTPAPTKVQTMNAAQMGLTIRRRTVPHSPS